jgi:lysophospholipase L1-like esterase
VVSAGSYVLSVALLAVLVLSLGFSAVRLRQRHMPDWEGAPAHLVEAVVGVALLIWISELLGLVDLLYAGTVVVSALLLAAAIAFGPRVLSRGEGGAAGEGVLDPPPPTPPAGEASLPGGGGVGGPTPEEALATGGGGGSPAPTGPAGPRAMSLVAVGVVALVFAHWGLTTADALSRGIFNFDSLWYHMPFAVEMAQSHSVTGLHYTETVFTNWFYPQNSELLHAVGILIADRDTLSLFLNFGWLAIAFLAAWCIGRPYGRGPLTVVAAGVLLECHTLVVREPGAAKNDVMAAALLLAAIAILINAGWGARLTRVARRRGSPIAEDAAASEHMGEAGATGPASQMLPLAVAGLATGLAVGTKSTALAMAAALTVAILVLAPAGRRWAAAGWWFAAGLAGGGYWYVRNLAISGNPLPQLEGLGPITLPHPERLQEGRPDFSIAHYATDTGVWSDYFRPELHEAFGALWPAVILAAIAGGITALLWGRTRVLRWIGGVALFGMLAYLFTPLSAAGPEGAPEGFGINLRYAIPALLAGITLLPLASFGRSSESAPSAGGAAAGVPHSGGRREAASEHMGEGRRDRTRGLIALSLLVLVLLITNRADAVVRDPDRIFAWAVALLFVLIPAALLFARSRGVSRGVVAGGFAALALLIAAIGYPVQRDYLGDRFANADPDTSIPRMHLDSAYRWARGVSDARIGLAGTTAGFLQYGFYGTDLSNRVRYLGVEGPHGAFRPIQTCAGFRAAVNAADLDYLVTAPFLNFIESRKPVSSPEARWLRGEPAVAAIDREGPVTVWRVQGRLDPRGCGALNQPLRAVPQQPGAVPTFESAGPILDRNSIVILGDSYSAGEGADLYLAGSDTEDNPCHRSRSTYLASEFDIPASRIIACSGAVAADVLSPQPARTEAAQVAQLEAIRGREGVDAVVLTLGGNDAGFADIGASCLVPGRGGCDRFIHTGRAFHSRARPSDAFVDERLSALPALLRPAYLAIDQVVNGPGAHPAGAPVPILVLGYPAATPAAPVECGRMHGWVSPGEIGFLNDLSRRLNDTIDDTVAAIRAERRIPIFYVGDTEDAFRPDHSICDPVSYVRRPASFNGAGLWILRQGIRELLHPNPAGYAALSRAMLRWSRGQAAADAVAFLESAPVNGPGRR